MTRENLVRGARPLRPWVIAGLLAAVIGCGGPKSPSVTASPALVAPAPNILLVIGDDMGLDASVCHSVAFDPGRAPRIASICARGVVFDNVWAAPLCSPTRAAVLTGRHGFRNTVGTVNQPLPLTERALPLALVEGNPSYVTAAVGKWHLSTAANGGNNHPNLVGFSRYAGNTSGALPNYFSWPRTVDGVTVTSTEYATTVAANDARDWIALQSKPWLMWLAFNAGHAPYHVAPAALHTYGVLAGPPFPARPIEHYHAMIEAMDTELGRLIDGLSPAVLARTWIIFLGDNGTPDEVTQSPIPRTRGKGDLYQGGVQVALTIAGPGVVAGGRRVGALAHVLDVFKTILELAQVDMARALPPGGNTVDSVSLVPYLVNPGQAPLRPWVMTELFGPPERGGARNGKAIRDTAFKLIRFDDTTLELYDLRTDPYEAINLMASRLSAEAETHRAALVASLDTLLASR